MAARRRRMAVRGGGAWLACLGELWVALVGEGEPPRKANARWLISAAEEIKRQRLRLCF